MPFVSITWNRFVIYAKNNRSGQVNQMKKIELSRGIIQYIFEAKAQQYYGKNIIALINEDKALLIDTGLEDQTEEVVKDLKESNITIEKVIISHFHNNHMQGLKILPDVTVYGSSHYKQTLDLWTPPEEHQYYKPTVLIDKRLVLKFGNHNIEMLQNPGHSLCTILVKINDEFLYIADELIFSNTGEPILPRVTKSDIINHYISAHNLIKCSQYTFIPSHGMVISDPNNIVEETKNVCRYLCEILSNDDKITVEEATKNCSCTFLHKEWHEDLYQ
jgi:glyoxylase-like metal-dependent hydrolase (beta-lactamase superfamily II)